MNTLTVKIEKLSDKGVGIAYANGDELFIKDTLPDDIVDVILDDYFVKGSKRRPARVVNFISKNKDHVSAPCPYYANCGGCHLQHASYNFMLNYKKECMQASLNKIGLNFKVSHVEGFNLTKKGIASRNKSIRAFAYSSDGSIVSGFYEPYSHNVVPIASCLMESPWFSDFANALCKLFTYEKVPLYDELKKIGLVRNLIMRNCTEGRIAMLTVSSKLKADLVDKVKELCKAFDISCASICLNDGTDNNLYQGEIIYLTEAKTVKTKILDLSFNIGPNTFMQVNDRAMEYMYKRAIDHVSKAQSKDLALDLCCGVGTMTLPLSKVFNKVVGVEISKASVDAARQNAHDNGIDNVSFIASDFKAVLPSFESSNVSGIIADPARVGLGHKALASLCKIKGPLHLAMIFCSLKALERDIAFLVKKGFVIDEVFGVDMFENSTHVETVVLLHKE